MVMNISLDDIKSYYELDISYIKSVTNRMGWTRLENIDAYNPLTYVRDFDIDTFKGLTNDDELDKAADRSEYRGIHFVEILAHYFYIVDALGDEINLYETIATALLDSANRVTDDKIKGLQATNAGIDFSNHIGTFDANSQIVNLYDTMFDLNFIVTLSNVINENNLFEQYDINPNVRVVESHRAHINDYVAWIHKCEVNVGRHIKGSNDANDGSNQDGSNQDGSITVSDIVDRRGKTVYVAYVIGGDIKTVHFINPTICTSLKRVKRLISNHIVILNYNSYLVKYRAYVREEVKTLCRSFTNQLGMTNYTYKHELDDNNHHEIIFKFDQPLNSSIDDTHDKLWKNFNSIVAASPLFDDEELILKNTLLSMDEYIGNGVGPQIKMSISLKGYDDNNDTELEHLSRLSHNKRHNKLQLIKKHLQVILVEAGVL